MASLDETIKRLKRIESALRGGMAQDVAILGADLCADIANRVINTGKGSNGQAFTPYSTKKGPAFWYFNRSANAAGENRVRAAAKKRQEISYRDFREFNNRPGSPKNFSFTNEMWRGFGVKSVRFDGSAYVVTIGGKTKPSADRIEWMSGQEKRSIIEPSKQELETAKAAFVKRILNGR